jgi:adenylate cyclase
VATTRRLAAIMFTDMVGFTASAQTDEASALKLLREQEKLVRPLLKTHQGREIKSTGDGLLIEFDSALRAVQCAIDIHQHLQERNSRKGVTPIQLRIGVHLGDVEQRGGDIFGDSVNLAARIEPFAEPGGICISEQVFGQVRNKIPNRLEKLEPKVLKNVRFPMEIYRVVLPWTVREPPSTDSGPTRLAVLPFANISPDPKDEYFADGLTEELITVLSQLKELRVIARTSVTPYKSTSKGVSQIGAELGVDAVLEGSVRKAGDELRITVQLINVDTQEHAWASTYDRKLEKVFAVQTEIAKQVAEALEIKLRAVEEARLETRPAVKPDSYLAYLKGRTLLQGISKAMLESAKEQFELAISLDPTNAAAHSGLADATRLMGWWHSDAPHTKWDEISRRLAARAVELDPNLAEAHASLALVLWDDYDYVAAEKELKLALSLNPSYSFAHNTYASILQDEARVDEALLEFRLAEAADPLWTFNLARSGELLVWIGRLDEAFIRFQKLGELKPPEWEYHWLMAGYYRARLDLKAWSEEFDRYLASEPRPRLKAIALSYRHALSGEKEQARALLRHEETLREFHPFDTWIANAYAELGDLDECFRFLEKMVARHEIALQRWRLEPRLEHVRRDPRFQVLLKTMNLA